jgi:hypothetical protein
MPDIEEPKIEKRARPIPLYIPIVIISVIVVISAIGAGMAWAVFVRHSENPVVKIVANVMQIPAAKIGKKTILYSDFIKSKDTLDFFLKSEAAKQQGIATPMDSSVEKNVLEKLINQAALEELADERKISISDSELRAFFTDVIAAASSTTPDVGVYLLENYGWTEEDFRQNVLKPALLEQRLGVELVKEKQGDPNALALYLEERLKKNDVVRYLRFD